MDVLVCQNVLPTKTSNMKSSEMSALKPVSKSILFGSAMETCQLYWTLSSPHATSSSNDFFLWDFLHMYETSFIRVIASQSALPVILQIAIVLIIKSERGKGNQI